MLSLSSRWQGHQYTSGRSDYFSQHNSPEPLAGRRPEGRLPASETPTYHAYDLAALYSRLWKLVLSSRPVTAPATTRWGSSSESPLPVAPPWAKAQGWSGSCPTRTRGLGPWASWSSPVPLAAVRSAAGAEPWWSEPEGVPGSPRGCARPRCCGPSTSWSSLKEAWSAAPWEAPSAERRAVAHPEGSQAGCPGTPPAPPAGTRKRASADEPYRLGTGR